MLKGRSKSKLALTHDEALVALEQIREYIKFARKADMDGWGWQRDCGVCGNESKHKDNEELQEMVNMALLMGDNVKHAALYWGLAPGDVRVHQKHLINGFWAFGMGSRIEADGHWHSFPKDGDATARAEWFRGRFQWLAYQAERNKDLKEVRNCLKESLSCENLLEKIRSREEGSSEPKRALGLTEEHEKKLIEAEEKHRKAIIDARPVVEIGAEGQAEVEVK